MIEEEADETEDWEKEKSEWEKKWERDPED
jgi:hypothetical protein